MSSRLRPGGAALVAALCTVLPPPALGGGLSLSPLERAFLNAINKTRVEHGVGRVTISDTLLTAARAHSSDMVRRNYFAHGVFSRRLEYYGVTSGNIGEDLGYDAHVATAVPELVAMWLRSQPHRAVLLSAKYDYIGVGVSIGPFLGHPKAVVVTADFRGPLPKGDHP
jgi:uncharacterized protein YkwD